MDKKEHETVLSCPCSDVAAMFGTNAIRILYAGAFCDDGGMRMDSLSLLSKRTSKFNMGVWCFGITISTFCEDFLGENCMEHCGCGSRYSPDSPFRERI